MSGDIEKENITLQRFMWTDENHKCEAGRLLFALNELTMSEKHMSSCNDESVVDYLKDKGIVEQNDQGIHLVDGKFDEAENLGNRISDHVGSAIEAIPVDKKIHFLPSIHMMAVPLPCVCENKED